MPWETEKGYPTKPASDAALEALETAQADIALNADNRQQQLQQAAAELAEFVADGEISENYARGQLRRSAEEAGMDDTAITQCLRAGFSGEVVGTEEKPEPRYSPPAADPSGLLEAVPDTGFIAEYFSWVEGTTDAPKHFHLPGALTCISAALGNRVYVPFGPMSCYPNLYTVIMAPSSRYRKSSVLRSTHELLRHLTVQAENGDQKHEAPVVLPEEFSPEAFFETLSERPVGVLLWSELSIALAQFGRQYAQGLAEFFTAAYDVPPKMERRLRNEKFLIERPCFSILAATTPEWATNHMTANTAIGGFLPRFCFFSAEEPGEFLPIPDALDPDKEDRLAGQLGHLRKCYPDGEETVISLDPIRDTYEAFARDLDQARHGGDSEALHDAFITRFGPLSLSLALLFEAAANPGTLSLSQDSFSRAVHVIDYLRKFTPVLLDELTWTDWEEWRKKAAQAIRDAGEKGITKSDLTRGSLRGMEKMRRDQLLEALEEEGVAERLTRRESSYGPMTTRFMAAEYWDG